MLALAGLMTKYGNKSTNDVTSFMVTEFAQAFGVEYSGEAAEHLANAIREDSEEKLSDWVMRPENTARLKELATERRDPQPGSDHSVIMCPHCRGFIDLDA
jgi:hypothetical protein